MSRPVFHHLSCCGLLFSRFGVASLLVLCGALGAAAQTGEKGRICEVKPIMKCLDKALLEDSTLQVPLDAAAIQKDGFLICDSSFNYTTAPDIVLVMDNTASMDSIQVVDGLPRWCQTPDKELDFGCISGDPSKLRGPALRTFLDSALVKGGKGINVGVVTFARSAEAKSESLLPLTAATLESIKSSVEMASLPSTNYTDAFNKARDLLATSRKPKSEQFIIFVSDGRPNFPEGDVGPYAYKSFWDSLPVVHSIFLGDNINNYKDMQELAQRTGGTFLPIKDVNVLAKYLTDDLAKKLFRRASPTLTTVRNLSDSVIFQIPFADHIPNADSTAYTLKMPGPLELVKGDNQIVIKTEYGYGGSTQDVHFTIHRSATGPFFAGLEEKCRGLPNLVLYNSQNQALNYVGLPFTIGDSAMRYSLTTAAELDSFYVVIKTTGTVTAQQDLETVLNSAANRKDSTWSGSVNFQHLTIQKTRGDNRVQIEHGEYVVVTYRNPFIREDSASAKVRMKYGPEFEKAAYRDLNGDGRIETVTLKYFENLATLPLKLVFKIKDEKGETAERIAVGGEIRFGVNGAGAEDGSSLVVTLAKPFPFGMTSVANPDSSGRTFRQLDIPMIDGFFRVDDSVPPVIVRADVTTDKSDGHAKVTVSYSEQVKLAEPFHEPLIFKRDTVTFTIKDMPLNRIEKVNDRVFIFHLQAGTAFSPVGGDSVSINDNGETRDLNGTLPKSLVFSPMGGPSPRQSISDFYVTFANGSKSDATGGATSPDKAAFIPVDSKGYALPGDANGKCGN
nr:VWA domain-containing protein [Fibrobacterota bacterium]